MTFFSLTFFKSVNINLSGNIPWRFLKGLINNDALWGSNDTPIQWHLLQTSLIAKCWRPWCFIQASINNFFLVAFLKRHVLKHYICMCEISSKHTIPSKISFSHPPYHLKIYKFSYPHLSSIYGLSP